MYNIKMINLKILQTITAGVIPFMPYLAILLVAISFLVSIKLFEHHLFRYSIFLRNFYIFLILFIIDIFINYFLPYNFWFIYIFLFVYVFLLYYVYVVTKKYGLLPIEVVVFINLVAFGTILYSLVPIGFAVAFLGLIKEFYIFLLLFILGILFLAVCIKNALDLGADKREVLHILWAIFLYVLLFVYSFYNGQALYFNIYKFYFISIIFAGIIEFISHFPTISKAPQYTGFKKWFWLVVLVIVLVIVGGLVG